MIYDEQIANNIAAQLLQIKAIVLNIEQPFTWASGWKSPIYCDNRKTLSYPEVRSQIRDAFVQLIRERFPKADCIAGVATGGIAQGSMVADKLNLPFVYVRSKSKGHGLGNLIEGVLQKGNKVVVIEDLVSTGMSSLNAVEALRNAGVQVEGMAAVFTYDLDIARKNFNDKNCTLYTLSDYPHLIDIALKNHYINPEVIQTLREWRKHPSEWGKMPQS